MDVAGSPGGGAGSAGPSDVPGAARPKAGYEPPAIRVLGTLADLTLSGTASTADGSGYAGASGTI